MGHIYWTGGMEMRKLAALALAFLLLILLPSVKASGNTYWAKTYGGSKWDEAYAITVAPNGDIIVVGRTNSFGAGSYDAWILRLDANGNVKWQKTYGGSDTDEANALASNGNIIIAGKTESFGAGSYDAWVLQLPPDGSIVGFSKDSNALTKEPSIQMSNSTAMIWDSEAQVMDSNALEWSSTSTITTVVSAGILKISSNPSRAKIYIDNEYQGITPLNVTICPGTHTVKLVKANYHGYNTTVTIAPEEVKEIRATLTQPEGILKISSSPSGAKVYVNGTYKGVTPLTLTIEPGIYTVSLVKDGYKEYTKTTVVYPGGIVEISTPLKVAPGTLKVDSNPSGAKVYVDDVFKGTTPLTLDLEPGTYNIKIAKQDYEDYTITVTLSAGETNSISATLKPVYSYLNVDSSPSGAEVYVDGDYVGKTPLEGYRLSPGEHRVKVKMEGYEVFTRTITVNPGETASISASLAAISAASGSTTTKTITTHSSTSAPSETTTTSSQTYTQTENPSPAPAGAATGIKTPYVIGALAALAVLGGIAVKARGGKPGERPKPAPKTEQERKQEVAKGATLDFPSALLSRYEPLEFLGEGGFARVFKARRKEDGRIVALKIPRIDEKTSRTFIKEVSTWLHLNHPNIVRLYDVDILPIPYLEMEFVEGVEMDGKAIRDLDGYPKPADEKTALKLIRDIAEGLKYAHSKGIYHRDLKPQNILLRRDLTPKITDWGLAKLGTMSSSRSVLGYTPLYASPEHLMPSKYGHTDERTDIWQLGVTFYELLIGRLPFEGYTYEEVFGKITDGGYKFKPLSEIKLELAKYDGIFEKLLAKRKEDRYQSVEEFLKDLEKLKEAEKRKAELEREVESLKRTLAESVHALKRSKSPEEIMRNRRLVVEALGKLALAYAELNRKAELLNTLSDMKFYTVQNLADLTSAISITEMLIKENIPISGDFIERLKVLVHSIRRENGA